MKLRWLLAACAYLSFAAFGGNAALAQDHHDDHHEHHWDEHNPKFDDHEHQAADDWWAHHRDHPVVGFRASDRLPAAWEPRLAVGFTFTSDWRRRTHPVPTDLLREFPPAPRGYHYYVIGGHVVLVDPGWRVADVININI